MNNPWVIDMFHLTLRLLLAMVLGGLIGYEREQSNRAAGLRTHILVCIGSTAIMLLSIYGFSEFANEPSVRMDPARLAAQVITGIGFLGAGVILYNGISITGLTTAASLWVVAAIGLSIGAGFYYVAGLATFLVLFCLIILNKVEQRWFRKNRQHTLRITADNEPGMFGRVAEMLQTRGVDIRKFTTETVKDAEGRAQLLSIALTIRLPKKVSLIGLVSELQSAEHITQIRADE